jgi:hypothetical protein
MTSDIRLRISPGHALDRSLYVRLSPSYAPEFRALAEGEGLSVGEVLEFSAGSDLVILAVAIFGAGTPLASALASVVKAFFSRNSEKLVEFGENGEIRKAGGFSAADIVALTEDAARRQLELDQSWRDAGYGSENDTTPDADASGQVAP